MTGSSARLEPRYLITVGSLTQRRVHHRDTEAQRKTQEKKKKEWDEEEEQDA
jgi:hypothetical protein